MKNPTRALQAALLAAAALAFAVPAAAGRYQTLDDLFYKVAGEAEGFAGAWYTTDGALNVAIRPAGKSITRSEQDKSLDTLVAVFGKGVLEPVPSMKRPQPAIGKVVYRQADYDFRELYAWYRELRTVLRVKGARYTDIDERANRLVIGVPRGKPNSAVINHLAKLNVPGAAVLFEDSQELYYFYEGSIIGSEQRPATGGIEIGLEAGGRCTIGVNAFFPEWWWERPGFITAGHCGSPGDWSADAFTQPDGGEVIAAERLNPGFVGGDDCPTDGCRFSDAAAANYDDDVDFSDEPTVIRTMDFDSDVNIDTSQPTIDVTGESPWNLSGDQIYKVGVGLGFGGGWTRGLVGATCVDRLAPGSTTETFVCQYEVDSEDGAPIACVGDSGAPTFYWHETIMPNAAISGLLWAGTSQPCATTYVFSPMGGVREDLGEFRIFP